MGTAEDEMTSSSLGVVAVRAATSQHLLSVSHLQNPHVAQFSKTSRSRDLKPLRGGGLLTLMVIMTIMTYWKYLSVIKMMTRETEGI